jgi:hypothetical protein
MIRPEYVPRGGIVQLGAAPRWLRGRGLHDRCRDLTDNDRVTSNRHAQHVVCAQECAQTRSEHHHPAANASQETKKKRA